MNKALKILTENQDRQSQTALPVYVRPPKRGQEFYSGLSRTKLYELEALGLIKGISVKGPGKDRGTKLYHLGSILAYIKGQAE
jgi:hypothetical protein